jgi:predicted nucleotidyltransferase component of viral defense system
MTLFEDMLSKYELTTNDDIIHASRELMQEIALAGLYRGGFFEKAAFYGGTCMRIFHKLDRFSEDLDFSLLKPEQDFSLKPYFEAIKVEFVSLGLDVEILSKNKTNSSEIESAFLKQTSAIYNLSLKSNKNIKIKFEVDTNPPHGFSTENKLLLQPFSFFVKTYQLPDLFAGKMHALLFRNWKNRVKGRDWYDFEWFVRNQIPLNFNHFLQRSFQSSHLPEEISEKEFVILLQNKIDQLNYKMVKEDVFPFIKDFTSLDIWSKEYFLELVKKIKIL